MWAWMFCLGAAAIVLVRWRRSRLPLIDYLGICLWRVYTGLWHGWSSRHPAALPRKGAAILMASHTCSADPVFLIAATRRLPNFLIAHEYFRNPQLARLFQYMGCVPVRRGVCDVTAARQALRRLSEGRILCIFPEAGLSNAGRGRLGTFKAGAAYLALRSQAPVYPVAVVRGPQTSSVLTAWLLPSRVRIRFGTPVDLRPYYGRRINRKLIEEVSTLLARTLKELHPGFEPGRRW
ncbi:MAG: 1-acyl-sn-glycerol-3-phosphate acyltransferase [Gemmataceae bacterium]|nr:1-acyl-sn-glycerol-3-phosphate acyltransferase [Gemmataceae bacterium]